MTIKVGDTLPSLRLTLAASDGSKETSTDALFGARLVVLFGTPGAFTPTCSAQHLPGYLNNLDALTEKGVETVVSVDKDKTRGRGFTPAVAR